RTATQSPAAPPGWPANAADGFGSCRLRLRTDRTGPSHSSQHSVDRRPPCQESRNDVRVELEAGLDANRGGGGIEAQPLAIRTVGGQGIEDVGDRQDSHQQGDRGPRQAGWISGTVPAFVVIKDTRQARLLEAKALELVLRDP